MSKEKKTLVIVESPTKAETIKRYLPDGYTVMASKGHVRDLPEDRLGIDIVKGFQPEYVITEGKEKLIGDLKRKLKDSDELLLATDEDREGESISWHLSELLKPQVPTRRMVFHEITRQAVSEALSGGRELDMNLVKAQEDRRIIDRLYGYEVSPVLWRKLSNKKLSGGRVQSVGLRFIVEKELDRLTYKTSEYHDIKASFEHPLGAFSATLESVDGQRVATGKDFDSATGGFNNKALILDDEACRAIIRRCDDGVYTVSSAVMKPSTSSPQPPFTTSTLQQAASSRLHLSSRETMRIAQSLFEHGFITYMRTDSVNLSDECIHASREQIEREFGSDYLNAKPRHFANKSKNAQEAHEAIRPAGDSFRRPDETGLKGKELALYTLIWMRTLATQMAPARKSTTTIKISNGGCLFSSSGTIVLFPGFLRVYDEDEKDDGARLPSLQEGEVLGKAVLSANAHVTTPPARYTEASLIRKLEEQGIGRPSTYATIISTLLDRGYVREADRSMIPTFTGFAVNACMVQAFPQLVDYSYTSDMEDELDRIATGSMDSQSYLEKFYNGDASHEGLSSMIERAKASSEDYKTIRFPHFSGKAVLTDGRDCTYSVKVGPYGAYLATSLAKEDGKPVLVNIPSYALPGTMDDDDISALIEEAVIGHKEGSPDEIVLRHGQRGEYWQKGDKTCSVPRGRRKADDYTVQEIEYLLSLPRVVAKDDDGNEAMLNSGPYGFYINYKGQNHKCYKVPFNMSEDEAWALIGRRKEASSSAIQYADYQGRPLSVRRGRYGLFLKWGDENIRLPKREDQSFSQEELEALCDAAAQKKDDADTPSKDGTVVASLDGAPITVHSGRYGAFLKWQGANFRINSEEPVTAELAIASVKAGLDKKKGDVVLGELDGAPVSLAHGRYGAYLKWKGSNHRLPRGMDAPSFDDAKRVLQEEAEARKQSDVVIGEYEGKPVLTAHGRFGYYLKWDGRNIALGAAYKNDVASLTLEDAIKAIEKKR